MRIFDPNRLDLLNIGCGRQFHPSWTNVDLESTSPNVTQHNLLSGIPFDVARFDAVYHSHLLEHMTPEHGQSLVEECFRVLRPGGIMRIVVPDLEQITRLYLESHDQAWHGNERAKANYQWMKLELIDQMVRGQSGGLMGQYMTNPEIENPDFVTSRIGDEMSNCGPPIPADSNQADSDRENSTVQAKKPSLKERWLSRTKTARNILASRAVGWLLGKEKRAAFEEGLFRQQGEIHRWMYDRFSLKELCEASGFENVRVCTAFQSGIEDFESFQLDSLNDRARKPDSLYVECVKPRLVQQRRMAA